MRHSAPTPGLTLLGTVAMHSLSSRVLILTAVFVMLAEVLIFLPSVARFRHDYLVQRIGDAHLGILALDATPDGIVSDKLKQQLLDFVGAQAISVRRSGMKLTLMEDNPRAVDSTIRLEELSPLDMISGALDSMIVRRDRVLQVIGYSPKDMDAEIEVVIDEAPISAALLDFGWRIFLLSLVISLFTAGLVFLALHWILIRPLRRITANMTAFRDNPEDATRIIAPTDRRDEVGVAEKELASMQEGLRAALQQKEHLAALGTAVAKINHDLKGILSRAILVFDRLEESDDPEVRRITPMLISSIDRAIAMCSQTLNYVGQESPSPNRSRFALQDLLDEVCEKEVDGVALSAEAVKGQMIDADRDQLYRALSNLIRNAVQAGAQAIDVSARQDNGGTVVDISDDGPGLPPRAQENLFKPFKGSTRAGGSGLGLAIARELLRGHGGDLELLQTSGSGTTFRLTIPDRAAA